MRTISLFPDWDALLFWRDEQSQEKIDDTLLPFSPGLRQRLDDFYRWFSELYLDADDRPSKSDNRLFDDRGIELWEQLRSELPHFHVIYYSQEFAEYFDSAEQFKAARKDARG